MQEISQMNANFTEYLTMAAEECPDKIAFADAHESMDYRRLQREAAAIGGFLASKGLYRKPVALVMQKSCRMMAAIYGVLYSGNYYTALSPDLTAGDFMRDALADFAACVVITDEAYAFLEQEPVSRYEEIVSGAWGGVRPDPLLTVKDAMDWDVFCVLYTSGSTGTPKGVVRTYFSNKEMLENITSVFGYDMPEQRRGVVFSSSSVAFLADVMGVVKGRGTGFLLNQQEIMNPAKLMRFLSQINVMVTPMALLKYLDAAGALEEMELPQLEKIAFGGEAADLKVLKNWISAWPKTKYINVYGSSECGMMTWHQLSSERLLEADTIPIGKAFVHQEILVLSEDGDRITKPKDGTGEVYVKSGSNAAGYLKKADLSEKTFVQNPLHHDYRDIWVKTGDLACYDQNGDLLYAGRNDWVVNRRGYRIELEGIERKVLEIPGVAECGCIYDREMILLFYAGEAQEKTVMDRCRQLLPHYMLPDRIRRVDRIGHNRNGKVDRIGLKKLHEETV